ncbi:NADH-quinone oxidoreductase subunit NuoE [candidate division GN15 bacterium]|nr:NADH-quinone oxidoreductase subunit NuoE [candidate division GN15 bacterium]
MLSQEEKAEIDKELSHVPTKQAACLGALKIVQAHRDGWVTDEGLLDVAEYLDMSPDELDSVATFYNLIFRRPVGRHKIFICDSVSCWITGYKEILEHLHKQLGIRPGETTPDNKFTLLPIPCLGICDHAPAFIIDETTYVDLTPDKVEDILKEYD